MTEGADDITRITPSPGTSFGPYEIVESLGAGGMGEVYRARDSKLGREVALKFLPEELSSDEGLLARFDREAKLLALVNHPNIATIHSIEEAGGKRFLVLELVEGENLANVLARSPLPLHQALKSSRDVAEALEAAHRKGIVHRDLKPANVILTPDNHVKVLDFGIAKPVAFTQAASDLAEHTPSGELTATGTLVGTGPYMSPEQVRGQEAGRRADIWSFGCLMYQMLTGKPAFGRDTLADTLTSILEREPDWSELPAKTPESVIRLMKRCLRKDPSERLQHIGDARIEIDEAIRTPSTATVKVDEGGVRLPWWQVAAGVALLLAIGVVVGAFIAGLGTDDASPPATPTEFGVQLPEDTMLDLGRASSVAISRDGTRVVMALHNSVGLQLYKRDRRRDLFEPIEGTEGAEAPFFSPDGDQVAFFAEGQLRTISYEQQDDARPLCDATDAYGGTWGDDGYIYFSASQQIYSVREGGGDRRSLEIHGLENEQRGLRWPHFLPNGELLFTVWGGSGPATSIYRRATDGSAESLYTHARQPQYAAGYLLFARGEEIFAVRFDNGAEPGGSPVQVRPDVLSQGEIGVSHFAVAREAASLVWVEGSLPAAPTLAFVDASGGRAPEPIELDRTYDNLGHPRFSPDGRRVLISVTLDETNFVGILDLERGGTPDRVRSDHTATSGEWSADGEQVAYTFLDDEEMEYGIRSARPGSADGHELITAGLLFPSSWSASDQLLFTRAEIDMEDPDNEQRIEVWVVGVNDNRLAERALLSDGSENYHASFSRNGELIAYVSNEFANEASVYVARADGSAPRPISDPNCNEPMWGAGETLYYRCGHQMMAVDISSDDLEARNPRRVFALPFARDDSLSRPNYDFDPTSRRFLMVSDEPIVTARQIKWRLDLRDYLSDSVGAPDSGR